MKTIKVTIADLITGKESDTELNLNEREYHLIGFVPYVTDQFEVVAVEGERLDPETGRYKSEN